MKIRKSTLPLHIRIIKHHLIGILTTITVLYLFNHYSSHEKKKKYWEQLEMRCRHNNRRNGHNPAGGGAMNGTSLTSSMAVANSTISGSILGSCSSHCHSSLLENSNPHCGCGCPMSNYSISLQHHPHLQQLHQRGSRTHRNNGMSVYPILDQPDFCAWDSCDDRYLRSIINDTHIYYTNYLGA